MIDFYIRIRPIIFCEIEPPVSSEVSQFEIEWAFGKRLIGGNTFITGYIHNTPVSIVI